MGYRPGTLHDGDMVARHLRRMEAKTQDSLAPTSSQLYQTTDRVAHMSGSGQARPSPSRVVSSQAAGWRAGSTWGVIASISVPRALGWGRALLHVSAQGVAVSSRGRALRLRISVDGVAAALGVAAYAGPDLVSGSMAGGVPGLDLSGERLICMGVDVEAAQGASVTLEACCPDDSAYRGPDNQVLLSMRVDYREA